ncbi:MAG: zf-HC2 domain-containing protein [Lachnospiraceae bacterium]|nr:zf-HC2 domain-containing protein [Lachnospiraceae bacterium]
MTCMETQRMITPFINDELSLKETEAFVDHVNSCPECREELEVYYALLTAMKQLDEDKILYDDFSMELSAKLEKAQERIIHAKFAYYRKKGAVLLIILLFILALNWRYNGKKEPVVIITESDFRLRLKYQSTREDPLDAALQTFMEKQEKIAE